MHCMFAASAHHPTQSMTVGGGYCCYSCNQQQHPLQTSTSWSPTALPLAAVLYYRHPLNCEPPMDALMASGFITPPSLHYVRNHGAVPKINWSSHRLTINGLVDTPITLTMDELIALPSVTLPVTLVCAGNRWGARSNQLTFTPRCSRGAAQWPHRVACSLRSSCCWMQLTA